MCTDFEQMRGSHDQKGYVGGKMCLREGVWGFDCDAGTRMNDHVRFWAIETRKMGTNDTLWKDGGGDGWKRWTNGAPLTC